MSTNINTAAASSASGEITLHDLFALTDEQILEIEPERATTPDQSFQSTSRDVIPSELAAGESRDRGNTVEHLPAQSTSQDSSAASRSLTGTPVGMTNDKAATGRGAEPPQWVAEVMNDPQRGGEVRAFWEGTQKAQQEAAAYREVFAKPEEARSAAERARLLDDIDRAYFAGDTHQRAQLAAVMLREDPAAFREMVFAGLRALEEAGKQGSTGAGSVAAATGRNETTVHAGQPSSRDSSATGRTDGGPPLGMTQQTGEHLAAYAAFEKTANQDLEQSVGGAIERALVQALPQTGKNDSGALRERLGATIRQEIEKALQGDRQLGEQVSQILAARRLDDVSRSQVVRLIGERARQLVPGAAKRVLQDWTQTALAAHRAGAQRSDAATARREVAPASSAAASPRAQENQNRQREAGATRPRPVDYRKLSDEQILEM